MERVFFFFLLAVLGVASGLDVAPNMRSFSSAIKAGSIGANVEKVLYEHRTGNPGVITEQWFTGRASYVGIQYVDDSSYVCIYICGACVPPTTIGIDVMDERMRIRIYIDDETEASLDFQLLLAHGVGFTELLESSQIPWGTRRVAHAADGGIYNTYRVPFWKSFRVTAMHPKGGQFFYIVRGVENMPVVVGDLTIPSTDTRLRLYKNVDVKLSPLEFLTLVNTSNTSNTAGMLFQVTLAANSTDFNYLEACFRARIDGSDNVTWLSSGTEDFFLSAYYFNRGTFHHENSGLTYKSNPGAMSAYKFFENDPLLFSKSFELVWRCGETINSNNGCPNDWPPPSQTNDKPSGTTHLPKLANTLVTTYAWYYEYTL